MSGVDTFERIGEHLFKCTTCGKEVPSGIINISGHWASCSGKELMDKIHAADKRIRLMIEEGKNKKK